MSADMTWSETWEEILDTHAIRDGVASVLLWEDVMASAQWFGAGVAFYIMVDVFELGTMTIIGSICILQLLVFRICSFLQSKGFAFDDVDLKKKIVLTPDASAVAKSVEVAGDVFRVIEETIKELSLTSDYIRLAEGFSTLLFLSALGRVVTLPILLLGLWTISFTVPVIYVKNQEKFDKIFDKSLGRRSSGLYSSSSASTAMEAR